VNLLINFSIFHLGWLACVVGAANNRAAEGCIAAVALLAVHLYRAELRRNELALIVVAALTGLFWESALLSQGWFAYAGQSPLSNLAPYWLLMIWALFATTINGSLAWMKGRLVLSMVMGAVFGPMAFVAGEKLGAIVFTDRPSGLLALALGWAVLMPLVMWIADRINRDPEHEEPLSDV
jgi:hypothetical protein|tara:strand:- start:3453 stop:3992 length:540 start_codon:yes stop_codon:yes gene_type:complete